jgi:hypothetical protein
VPGARFNGAKIDVSGNPVGSKAPAGFAGRCCPPPAWAANGDATVARRSAALNDRDIECIGLWIEENVRTAEAAARESCMNQAARPRRARRKPASVL